MNTCQICHNYLNDVTNDNNIIIKFGANRYFIHKQCYNLNNKCIYSESSINSFYEQQISYIFIDEFLYTLVKLPNIKSNIFSFAIYLLFFFVIIYVFAIFISNIYF
jgi:hypothetical protein